MNVVIARAAILAQNNFFEDVSRRVRKPTSVSAEQWWVFAAALVAVIALVVLASWHTNRRTKATRCNSPLRLFWSLCQAHGLLWRDRWLLWQLGRRQKVANPARLFVEPEHFDSARSRSLPDRYRANLERLQERLFAEGVSTTDRGATG